LINDDLGVKLLLSGLKNDAEEVFGALDERCLLSCGFDVVYQGNEALSACSSDSFVSGESAKRDDELSARLEVREELILQLLDENREHVDCYFCFLIIICVELLLLLDFSIWRVTVQVEDFLDQLEERRDDLRKVVGQKVWAREAESLPSNNINNSQAIPRKHIGFLRINTFELPRLDGNEHIDGLVEEGREDFLLNS
jgi:2,4-dienoyl-CoA reductase-like NADH-dependent reductase (Old Yellow Enzyme family)